MSKTSLFTGEPPPAPPPPAAPVIQIFWYAQLYEPVNPFSSAVAFWGINYLELEWYLPKKRDCSPEQDKSRFFHFIFFAKGVDTSYVYVIKTHGHILFPEFSLVSEESTKKKTLKPHENEKTKNTDQVDYHSYRKRQHQKTLRGESILFRLTCPIMNATAVGARLKIAPKTDFENIYIYKLNPTWSRR